MRGADSTERLRNEAIGGGLGRVLATDEGSELRRTLAVRGTDRTSELDAVILVGQKWTYLVPLGDLQVGVREVVAGLERRLEGDDLVETDVRVEARLDLREDRDGAVSTSSTMQH